MNLPASLKGESGKRLLQGLVLGVIATVVIGFYWGGWVTQRSAEEMARSRAETVLVTALVPICIDKFRSSATAAHTAELKDARAFMQGGFIARGGWATTLGSDAPNAGGSRCVCGRADRCAEQVAAQGSPNEGRTA